MTMTHPSTEVVGNPLFARLPERFQWTIHNMLGHPLSEVVWQVGISRSPQSRLIRLSDWLHEWTVPLHEGGTGRG